MNHEQQHDSIEAEARREAAMRDLGPLQARSTDADTVRYVFARGEIVLRDGNWTIVPNAATPTASGLRSLRINDVA